MLDAWVVGYCECKYEHECACGCKLVRWESHVGDVGGVGGVGVL